MTPIMVFEQFLREGIEGKLRAVDRQIHLDRDMRDTTSKTPVNYPQEVIRMYESKLSNSET